MRASTAAWRICSGAIVALVSAWASAGCEAEGGRPLGGICDDDAECDSGLCIERVCFDPDGDLDGDTLVNRLEAALGTSPMRSDTDGDGEPDGIEIGPDVVAPLDGDGDGKLDAIESLLSDQDGDCLPDQRDADDEVRADDLALLAELMCCCEGPCSGRAGPAPVAACVDGPGGARALSCTFAVGAVDLRPLAPCTCEPGWVGPTCGTAVCDPPCDHGGACVAPDVCDCAGTGFAGPTCATRACDAGWIGPDCDTPVCDPACGHGGACVAPAMCDCAGTGFTGPTCGTRACVVDACPSLEGYLATCNDAGHCEYLRATSTEGWHDDDVWVLALPGTFPMGAPEGECGSCELARPVHEVTLARAFLIMKYEVSVRTHEACVAAPDAPCAALGGASSAGGRALHPKGTMAAADAAAVCAWLGGRRPTEAEWEYAANGPSGHRRYPWGDAPEPECGVHAVFAHGGAGCGVNDTWSIGVDERVAGASGVGAHDMAGNVWEWVEDCYHEGYAGAPVDGSAWTEGCGEDGVVRGGSLICSSDSMRTAHRGHVPLTSHYANIGVRCVRPMPE